MQNSNSGYVPVITPVDIFTKEHPQDGNAKINSDFSKPGAGAVRINNDFLERMNVLAKGYFFVLTISVYIAIISYTESVYSENCTYLNYFTTYVLFNIFGNYYMCMRFESVFKAVEATDLPNRIWTFCTYCQVEQPPRVHHCPLCHKCISKRDHHCFFTGKCVGERNQGFFVVYCFHVFIGLYIGFQVISVHLTNTFYELYSLDFYHYFPPVSLLELLAGRVDFVTFLLVFLMFGSFVTGIFTFLLFVWQFILIILDMTSYEAQLAWSRGNIVLSKLTPWRNITTVFGPIPFIPFLVPFPVASVRRLYGSQSSKYFV